MLRKQCGRNQSRKPAVRRPTHRRTGCRKVVCRKIAARKTVCRRPAHRKTDIRKSVPRTTGIIREITVHTKDLTRLVRRSVHMGTTIITITTIVTALRQLPCSAGGSRQPDLFYPELDLCPECGQPGACGKTGIQK